MNQNSQHSQVCLDKIEKMFNSRDKSMKKLAQKMCHELRIDYYFAFFCIPRRYRMAQDLILVYSCVKPIETDTKIIIGKGEISKPNRKRDPNGIIKIHKVKLNGTTKIK